MFRNPLFGVRETGHTAHQPPISRPFVAKVPLAGLIFLDSQQIEKLLGESVPRDAGAFVDKVVDARRKLLGEQSNRGLGHIAGVGEAANLLIVDRQRRLCLPEPDHGAHKTRLRDCGGPRPAEDFGEPADIGPPARGGHGLLTGEFALIVDGDQRWCVVLLVALGLVAGEDVVGAVMAEGRA